MQETELQFDMSRSHLKYSAFVRPDVSVVGSSLEMSRARPSKPLQMQKSKQNDDSLQVQLSQLHAENTVLRSRSIKLEHELAASQLQNSLTNQVLNQTQRMCDDTAAGPAAAMADKNAIIHQQKALIDHLKTKAYEAETRLSAVTKEHGELTILSREQQMELERLRRQTKEQEQTIQQQYKLLADLQAAKSELTSELSQTAVRLAYLTQAEADLRAAVHRLTGDEEIVLPADLQQTISGLQETLKEKQEKIRFQAAFIRKLQEKVKQNTNNTVQLEAAQRECVELKVQISLLQEQARATEEPSAAPECPEPTK